MGCGIAMSDDHFGIRDVMRCWPIIILIPLTRNMYFLYKKVPTLIYHTVRRWVYAENSLGAHQCNSMQHLCRIFWTLHYNEVSLGYIEHVHDNELPRVSLRDMVCGLASCKRFLFYHIFRLSGYLRNFKLTPWLRSLLSMIVRWGESLIILTN